MRDPIISKYPIKLFPIDDLLEHCTNAFDKLVDMSPRSMLEMCDFPEERERIPCAVQLTIVTSAEGFGLHGINDWLYTNHARGGTLPELCAWLVQHHDRVMQFGHVVAPGTIFQDIPQGGRRCSYMPFARRSGELTHLSMRSYGATWSKGASFLAVLDADLPSST